MIDSVTNFYDNEKEMNDLVKMFYSFFGAFHGIKFFGWIRKFSMENRRKMETISPNYSVSFSNFSYKISRSVLNHFLIFYLPDTKLLFCSFALYLIIF